MQVGDIESMPFIEALRQFQFRVGPGNLCCVHVSLVPVLGVVGEQKTKPTQHSVAVLRSLGLNPALLACRSQHPLADSVRQKLVRHAPHVLHSIGILKELQGFLGLEMQSMSAEVA